jgi:hypothetical protein
MKLMYCADACRTVVAPEEEHLAVNTGDLMHLWGLVEEKDGGPSWIPMMDHTLPTMRYRAWRRDPPVCNSLSSLILATAHVRLA